MTSWPSRLGASLAQLRMGRALRHRNFRLFFAGQGISLIGTWLTRFAMGYETFALSHSTMQLGLVAFFNQAPTALIAPVAGVLVDRWNRHRVLIVTQIFALLQSAALAAFALTNTMTVWHLMVLGAAQAVITAFEMPARQSFVRYMVDDRADLPNALALNSALVNATRLLGPVIAAALVALFGIGWCFAVDAASYLAVIGSLIAMRVVAAPVRQRTSHVIDELRAGVAYVGGMPLVRSLMILFAVTCSFGGASWSLLPAIAEDTLHGGPDTLGWLMAANGAGALVGVLYLANRERTAGLERVAAICGIGVGLGLLAMEAAVSVWIAVPVMFVVGMGLLVQWTATNTLVQSLVSDEMLGRVMSLYLLVFFAGAPIGSLILGGLARTIGPIHAFAIAGAGCVACSLAFRRTLPRTSDVAAAA